MVSESDTRFSRAFGDALGSQTKTWRAEGSGHQLLQGVNVAVHAAEIESSMIDNGRRHDGTDRDKSIKINVHILEVVEWGVKAAWFRVPSGFKTFRGSFFAPSVWNSRVSLPDLVSTA